MITTLTFSDVIAYDDDPSGIGIPIVLDYQGNTVLELAKVDTGAAISLFQYEVGLRLGVPIEQGVPIQLGTLTGILEGFGHEVVLQTGTLVFQSTVYFAKHPGLPRNILGRRGWLRNLRLAVVDYDNLIYLNTYDA